MDDPNYPVRYDEQHRCYYRLYYDHAAQEWSFLDQLNWLPPEPGGQPATPIAPIPIKRRDSIVHPHGAQANSANAGPANLNGAGHTQLPRGRRGNPVQGTYNVKHPTPKSHYERLDPSYCVRGSAYFEEGVMFSILFTEPAGENALRSLNKTTEYNSAISQVIYNQFVHTQVRRFIVVRRKKAFCYAVPIFTYSGQGTLKNGVAPDEHAVAYSQGENPQLLPGEHQLPKLAICMVMKDGEKPLSIASRIYFGIHHPIQYNVKVKDLGYVHPDFVPTFLGYWNMEFAADTQQAPEVTTEAERAPEDEVHAEVQSTSYGSVDEEDDPIQRLVDRITYAKFEE